MDRNSQRASLTPTSVMERLEKMSPDLLQKIMEEIQERLNRTPDDSRLLGAIQKIKEVLEGPGAGGGDGLPMPTMAADLAETMDRLGQYDIADFLDDLLARS